MSTPGLAAKIERVHRAFDRASIPHAFGGALALAYYTVPRATVDIDVNVFVGVDQFEGVARVLGRLGVDAIPDAAPVQRDGQVRVMWAGTPLDLFFSYDPIHEAMQAATRTVPFGDHATIPILAPEHLLVAKAVFDRPKDRIDIEQMIVAVDPLDADEIRRWLHHLTGKQDPRYKRIDRLLNDLR